MTSYYCTRKHVESLRESISIPFPCKSRTGRKLYVWHHVLPSHHHQSCKNCGNVREAISKAAETELQFSDFSSPHSLENSALGFFLSVSHAAYLTATISSSSSAYFSSSPLSSPSIIFFLLPLFFHLLVLHLLSLLFLLLLLFFYPPPSFLASLFISFSFLPSKRG